MQNRDEIILFEERGELRDEDLTRLRKGEPVYRILGYRYFWEDKFFLSDDTLEPRSDTETLIEVALDLFTDKQRALRILDLGTGTGCILLSLLREFSNATGVGADLSSGALETAQKNALALELNHRTEWIESNWCESVTGSFDLIISNPPYIPSSVIETLDDTVKKFDPKRALDGGNSGLEVYEHLATTLPPLLNQDALILFEIGYDQKNAVISIMKEYELICSRQDLEKNDRCLAFRQFLNASE